MIDKIEFRNACGKFATGVVIVLTETDNEIRGMTANGFMSVSLEPALIVVSIGKNQKIHALINKSKTYSVNILAEESHNISNHFAGKRDDNLKLSFEYNNNIPILKGCIATFTAKVVNQVEAGDHTLFIGEVMSLDNNNEQPLLFYQGKYKKIQN